MIKVMTEMSGPGRNDQTFLGAAAHITSTGWPGWPQTEQKKIKNIHKIHHSSIFYIFECSMSEWMCRETIHIFYQFVYMDYFISQMKNIVAIIIDSNCTVLLHLGENYLYKV